MLKTIELKPVLLKPKEEFLKPININFQTKIGTTVYVVNAHFRESASADMVTKVKSLMTR